MYALPAQAALLVQTHLNPPAQYKYVCVCLIYHLIIPAEIAIHQTLGLRLLAEFGLPYTPVSRSKLSANCLQLLVVLPHPVLTCSL